MRRVVIESPYAGPTAEAIEANLTYARACMRDSLARGEAPIASHLLYTQPGILKDDVKEERDWGMRAGFAWNAYANLVAVYTDNGISAGMQRGIEVANQMGVDVEYRKIMQGQTPTPTGREAE